MNPSPGRKALYAHLAAYIAVNAVLLAINATQTPDPGASRQWWALWPLAGWGIGIAAHAFAEWAESSSGEGGLLEDNDIRGVAVHLFVYLAVNAFLIVINFTTSPESLWSIWPLLGWGVGLAAHGWLAYRAVLRKTMEHYATGQQALRELQLEQQAAGIASALETPKKKSSATRARRKQAGAKTTKKKAARKGTTATRAAKKPAAKKPASRKPAPKKS